MYDGRWRKARALELDLVTPRRLVPVRRFRLRTRLIYGLKFKFEIQI